VEGEKDITFDDMSIITTKPKQNSPGLLLEAADLILANERVRAFQRHYERQEYVSSQTIDNVVRQMSEAELSYGQVTTHGGRVTQADYTEYVASLRRQQRQMLFDLTQKELAPDQQLYDAFYAQRGQHRWLYGSLDTVNYDFFPQRQHHTKHGKTAGRWETESRSGSYNFAVVAYWSFLHSPFGAYFLDKADRLAFLGAHLPERLVMATFLWCYFRVAEGTRDGGLVLSLNDRARVERVAMEAVDTQSDVDNAAARRKFLEDNAAYIIYDRTREEPTGNYLELNWNRPSYFFVVVNAPDDVRQEKHFMTLTLIDLFKANLKPKRLRHYDTGTTGLQQQQQQQQLGLCMGHLCRKVASRATPDQRYGFCCDECFDTSPFAVEY
jgi:hypothetical protein